MGMTETLKTPKKDPQLWFVASDWHSFNLHQPSFNILINHANTLPKSQRNLIINGDFLDTPYLMPKSSDFKMWRDRKDGVDNFFLPEFEKEIRWANDTLDAIQSFFNHVIFIHGNHDGPRVDNFRENFCPVGYKEHFNLNKPLRLYERNIGSIGYNDWLDFGKLSITHGMYHGSTCHKKHYEAAGSRNVLFGHIHSSECKTFTVRGESRSAWSLPAMCGLNPHYIKNAETNWQNGYATVFMKPCGNFNLNIHLVFDGELLLPSGEIIRG
jgi:predicted phosphodiesterase